MKKFKKVLRLLGFVLLIILASVGVGIFGGIPIKTSHRREDNIEMVMEKADQEEAEVIDFGHQE